MKAHPSALKHGIAEEDAVQAAYWSQWVEPPGVGNELGPLAMSPREEFWDLLP